MGVVAQLPQHRSHGVHLSEQSLRESSDPLRQSPGVDWLDDLVRGSLHVADSHPARLVDHRVVAQHGVVPGQGEEPEDGADDRPGVEDQVLVLDPQTPAVEQ